MSDAYTFLPWMRRGLSNQISQPATTGSRARVLAAAQVTDGQRTAPPISQEFMLTGPGDLTGMDPDAIVRTEPRNWITDFEPNYLPFVEFYEEDFPWRYTPKNAEGSSNRRLIPWITLLVLEPSEFERNRTPGRPLTSIILNVGTPGDMFPPASQLWAWAHTQLVADIPGGDTPDLAALNARLDANPDAGLSRVLSPRKLDPEKAYHAFLIPTFEVGRKAGLGLAIDDDTDSGLALAWDSAGEFPVYHEWYFRTGERGDFEELARRLVPRSVDPRVGIRDMDLADPAFGMPSLADDSEDRIVGLEGALKSPDTVPDPHRPGSDFAEDIAAILNAPAEAASAGEPDPLVAPPIYGRWHALVERVDPRPTRRGWLDALNRDARHRAASGLGADVIRRNQETFMKRAWEQVGEVLEANRRIALAQAAMLANKKLLAKTFEAAQTPSTTVAIAGHLAKRVRGNVKTIRAELAESVLSQATHSAQMRKITRPRGPVEKVLAGGEVADPALPVTPRLETMARAINAKKITFASQPADIKSVTIEDGLDFMASQPGVGGGPTIPTEPVDPRPTFPSRPGGGIFAPTRPPRRHFGLPERPTDLGLPGRIRTETLTLGREAGRPGATVTGGLDPLGDEAGGGALRGRIGNIPARGTTSRRGGIPGLEIGTIPGRGTIPGLEVPGGSGTMPGTTVPGGIGNVSVGGAIVTILPGSQGIETTVSIGEIAINGLSPDLVAEAKVDSRFLGMGFSKEVIFDTKISRDFRITAPEGSAAVSPDAPVLGRARTLEFQKSLGEFSNLLNFAVPEAPPRDPLNTIAASARIVEALQPEPAFRKRLDARVGLGGLALDHFGNARVQTVKERIVPAMACPDFKDPMYRLLAKLGDEFLVPNLGLVPPNTISLMLTNPPFIEAYMVGLNVEFSSELLFREYPTDQRCTAFRQFWDVSSIPIPPGTSETDHIAALKDIEPIHTWGKSGRLGTNSPRTAGHASEAEPRVVLVIRGDLLKKYPNTIVYAQSARWGIGERRNELILHDEDGSRAAVDITDPDIHFPTFKAEVAPDLHFIGFNLTLDEVRGHPDLEETASARRSIPASQLGKYFVLQEVAGETRFGLDVSRTTTASEDDVRWDNLSWPHIDLSAGPIVDVSKPFVQPLIGDNTDGLAWGSNAADMAAILYQKPVMLAYHGRDMLKDL